MRLALAGISLLSLSCSHDPVIPETPAISFKDEVLPIIVNNCAKSGCHDGSGEFSLQNYQEITSKVHAGDARKSELYKVINTLWGDKAGIKKATGDLVENNHATYENT